MTKSNLLVFKKKALLIEASRWLGFTERGGNNLGEIISMFQSCVDGRASGESWCAGFVQYCLHWSDRSSNAFACVEANNEIYPTESTQQMWLESPHHCWRHAPEPGLLAVWQRRDDPKKGHVGIVETTESNEFFTIEGNTQEETVLASVTKVKSDGVYRRRRNRMTKTGPLILLGFLEPWPALTGLD